MEVRILGGQMARVPAGATAFAHRQSKIMVNIAAIEHRVEKRAEHEEWTTELSDALSDSAIVPAYAGFIAGERSDDVRRVYPPATLQRLVQVKRRYDPDNLFRLNLNIAPDVE